MLPRPRHSQTLNNLAKEREHAEEEQRRAAKGLVPSSIQVHTRTAKPTEQPTPASFTAISPGLEPACAQSMCSMPTPARARGHAQDALEMGYALYDAEIALLRKGNPLLQQSGSMPAQLSRAQVTQAAHASPRACTHG